MKGSSRLVRVILVTAAGLAIAFYLVLQIEPGALAHLVKNISFPWILTAFGFYGLSMFFRACRWQKMLLSRPVGIVSLFSVTALHTFSNHLLPARTGELSYVLLLRKTQAIPSSEGVATLVLARVFDLLTMGVFFLVSLALLSDRLTVPVLKLFLVTFFALPLLAVVFVGVFSRRGVEALRRGLSRMGFLKLKPLTRAANFLARLAEDLYQIKKSGRLTSYALLTFLVWAAKFFAFYAIVHALVFSESVSFWETVLGTTFSELASTLPVYGFAGLGTIEGSWTLGFLWLGYEKASVILNAFGFHFLVLCFSALLAVMGFFLLKKS